MDRIEDITPPEKVHMNNKCDRSVTLYGYLRGCNLKKGTKVCTPYQFFQITCFKLPFASGAKFISRSPDEVFWSLMIISFSIAILFV